MLDWFSSIFRQKPTPPVTGAQTQPQGRRLVLDDARFIEQALHGLVDVGLKPVDQDSFHATAQEIADYLKGISFSREPTSGTWAHIALSAERSPFRNSMRSEDHCFDGAELDSYEIMIANMIALAGDEWPIESVNVDYGPHGSTPFESRLNITIKATPEVAPFQLLEGKDFDWSIIFRLNERLPKEAIGRFAAFLDGGSAIIVFLRPEQIAELNSLCGYEFFYEEDAATRGQQS
jgi:hypothetical protein